MGDVSDVDQDLSASLRTLVSTSAAAAAAQAANEVAVETVLAQVRRLRSSTHSARTPDFLTVVRHVYWQHRSVPSAELAEAAGFRSSNDMTGAIGPVPSGIVCDGCEEEMRRTSRSWLPPQPESDGLRLCKPCAGQRRTEFHRKWMVVAVRREYVEAAPVTAPRADLMSAALLVLAYPPITVGWSLENAVHNGLWRGYEVARQVHEHLVSHDGDDAASVASRDALLLLRAAEEVAGWDAERSIELIDMITDDAPTLVLARLRRMIDEVRHKRATDAVSRFPDDHAPDPESLLSVRQR